MQWNSNQEEEPQQQLPWRSDILENESEEKETVGDTISNGGLYGKFQCLWVVSRI